MIGSLNDVLINNVYQLPNTVGNDGDVITSNGNGGSDWAAPVFIPAFMEVTCNNITGFNAGSPVLLELEQNPNMGPQEGNTTWLDSDTHIITPNSVGYYYVIFELGGGINTLGAEIRKNDVSVSEAPAVGNSWKTIVYMNGSSDNLSFAAQSGGGSITLSVPRVMMFKIG